HRAGRIEHEHEFLWRNLLGGHAVRWLEYESEETSFVGAMCEQCILNRRTRDIVTKYEVFVRNRRFVFETQSGAVSVWTLNVRGVSFGIDRINDQTGVECDFERDVVAAPHACRK